MPALAQGKIAEREIQVVSELDGSLGLLSLDARELHKAVMNVVVNAVEAMEPGGTLTVRTRRLDEGGVSISIADTGGGMDEATLGRSFDLFFTTKPGGTGLGMAIVRSVVDRHGGRLDIDTAPGRGTTIEISLPAVAGEPRDPTAES